MRLEEENKRVCCYGHDLINKTETPGCNNYSRHFTKDGGYCGEHFRKIKGYLK